MIRLKKTKNGYITEQFFLDCSLERALELYGNDGYNIEEMTI